MHPLNIFIESLRTDGFHPNVYDYHRINFALQAESPWDLTQLRNMLMVLLVKTPEQEAIFQQRFEAFFNVPELPLIDPLQQISNSPDTKALSQSSVDNVSETSDLSESKQSKRWLKFFLGLIAIIVLLGSVGYYFYRPQLLIQPTKLIFGEQVLGTETQQTIEISNSGLGPLTIDSVSLLETDIFNILTDNCSKTTLSRSQCTIEIQFVPPQENDYTATLVIYTRLGKSNILLKGSGTPLSIQPKSLFFGEQYLSTKTQKSISITNFGIEPITINQVTLNDGNVFNIFTDNCSGTTLYSRSQCTIEIQFVPQQESDYITAELAISTHLDESNILLTGKGTNPPLIWPKQLVFGEQYLSTKTQKSIDIIKLGKNLTIINQVTLDDNSAFHILTNNCSQTTLSRGYQCRIEIQFVPQQESNYIATLTISTRQGKSKVLLSGTGIEELIQTTEEKSILMKKEFISEEESTSTEKESIPIDTQAKELTQMPEKKPQRLYPDVPFIKNIISVPNYWKIYAIITGVLLLLLLIYWIWLWRSRQLPQDIPPSWQIHKPRLFSLDTVGGKPKPWLTPAILDQLADSIGYFQSKQASKQLNIKQTVQVSIQRRIPTLFFYPCQQVRTVLILEDTSAKPLAWNPITKELAVGLQQRRIPILYGKFYGSYQKAYTTEGVCYELKTLIDDLNRYILLIFSDGKNLRYDQDASMLKALAEWYQVAWLELREVSAWDESTAKLAEFGLPIYPATPKGLLQAIGGFISEAGKQSELTEVARNACGSSVQMGKNSMAGVEYFLGDALPWAQCCTLLQPISLGLAEALREQFFEYLPRERIERLFTLSNTTHTVNGLRFSRPIFAILRTGFLRRFTVKEQQQRLQFILEKLNQVEPTDKESPAHLAWEWYWQRVNLELNPDEALQSLAELAGTPLEDAICTELEHTVPPPVDGTTTTVSPPDIPLRLRPKTQVALQRLQKLAKHSGIAKLSVLPIGLGHKVIISFLTAGLLCAFGLSVKNYLSFPNIELINGEQVLAWGTWQDKNTLITKQDEPLTLAYSAFRRFTFLSRSGLIKTQEIEQITNSLKLELGINDETINCLSKLPTIGLSIQFCALDDANDSLLNNSQLIFPSWHDHLTESTSSRQLISIGLEIQTQATNEVALQTLHNLLLKTHSVDRLYRIVPKTDGKLDLSGALTELQTQLTPWQSKSQLIWWTVGNSLQNTQLNDFIASFGTVFDLDQGTDLSWITSVQQLLTSKDSSLSETEIVTALDRSIPDIVLIGRVSDTSKIIFRHKLKDGSLGPEMVLIPAGSFRMGNIQGKGESDEKPVHEVSIKYFAIGRYEITFDEYDKFVEATSREKPSDNGWGRGSRPVIHVSWEDATAYALWLSEQTGKSYRLPTEAEWEYAARAGTETKYWWGNKIGFNQANCFNCGSQWDSKQTAPVGSFRANPFGLYDTIGNVWEWVMDPWHDNYKEAPSDGSIWEGKGNLRVLRGGSWNYNSFRCRAAYRNSHDSSNYTMGFRLAVSPIAWTP